MSTMIDKGVEYVSKATQLDREEKYQEAFDHYSQAIEYFITGLKYEKNPKRAEIIRNKVSSYISRAEELKTYLRSKASVNEEKEDTTATKKRTKSKKSKSSTEEEDAAINATINDAIIREKPNVHWDDVAGQEDAKAALNEAVVMPLRYPQLFAGKREPWRGILLYGPPGTGKSYIAKAVATECDCTFFSVSASTLMSKWQGESEGRVAALFKMARAEKPSVIFLDEVDALVSSRSDNESESSRRIKTTFLTEMDGVSGEDSSGVLVLAATNIPWGLDSAIRRRFQRRVLINLPELEARKRMFEIHIGSTPNSLSSNDYEEFAGMTEGFSSDDIKNVVKDALMEPLRKLQSASHFMKVNQGDKEVYLPCSPGAKGAMEMHLLDISPEELGVPEVTKNDFLTIMQKAKPSVSDDDIKKHIEWADTFGTS